MPHTEPLFDMDPSTPGVPPASKGGPGNAGQTSKDATSAADMAAMPLSELVAPDWVPALEGVEAELRSALRFVAAESAAGHTVLPSPPLLLRVFREPMDRVKVLVIGQDPYPTPGHAVGLAFSVAPDTRPVPRSLGNIYRELESDLGYPPRSHGDLSAWSGQGVLLLNTVLSVRAGSAASHRRRGWEAVTTAAVRALVDRRRPDGGPAPLVAILWGKDAGTFAPTLGDVPQIASAHPSPLSASRGFFGSRPFSRANDLLAQQGAEAVTWEIPQNT